MSSLMKQFDSDCTIKCSGDASASCGGTPNFVSSYITDSSSELKPVIYFKTLNIFYYKKYS